MKMNLTENNATSSPTPDWDPQYQRLLQLKRYEHPSPEYFSQFLEEFQRRQRLAAMRPKWWERWQENFSDFLDHFRVPAAAYATVGVLAAGACVWIFTSEGIHPTQGALVEAEPPALRLELHTPLPEALPNPVTIPSQRMVGTLPPRYLLNNRPASEAEPFSF